MSINKVVLIGCLGKDPDHRVASSGKSMCTFSLATDDGKDKTEWHRIVCFDRNADNAKKYLAKGRQVYIEGRIQSNKYRGKDGVERIGYNIVAYTVHFFGLAKMSADVSQPAQAEEDPFDDDVPF